MTSQFSEAIKILKQVEDDEKNWRSSRQHLGELLAAAQSAEKLLPRVAALKDEIKALEASKASLEQKVTESTIKAGQLDTDLMNALRAGTLTTLLGEREAQVQKLDSKIKSMETKLFEAETAFEKFKSDHGMK